MQIFWPVLPAQLPEQHWALAVQLTALAEQHVLYTQPVAGLQLSAHALPSSQVSAVPDVQPVSESHDSMPLHALPSSQVSGVPDVQPVNELHDSTPLHETPSSQLVAVLLHKPVPASQLSVVQASPSLQLASANTQPVAASQVSLVHGLPSSQVTGEPGVQSPVATSHASAAHRLPVPHFGVETQAPALQDSIVHRSASARQVTGALATQPVAASQPSVVQGALSSQTSAVPATQV